MLAKITGKILNQLFTLDPESVTRIKALNGKRVQIILTGTGLSFCILFSGSEMIFEMPAENNKIDLCITTTPLTLIQMKFTKKYPGHVLVTGEMDLAESLFAVFSELDIDWEEQLSRLTGDIPAHTAGTMSRKLRASVKYFTANFLDSLAEYLHEEQSVLSLFPSAEAVADFCAEVDELSMAIDRLAAQLEVFGNKK